MGQRIPTRTDSSEEEVKTYIRDMLCVLRRLACDAELPNVAAQLENALAIALPDLQALQGAQGREDYFRLSKWRRSA